MVNSPYPNQDHRLAQDRFRHLDAIEAGKKPNRLASTVTNLRNKLTQRK